VILACTVLTQYRSVTDSWTDAQTMAKMHSRVKKSYVVLYAAHVYMRNALVSDHTRLQTFTLIVNQEKTFLPKYQSLCYCLLHGYLWPESNKYVMLCYVMLCYDTGNVWGLTV